MLAGEGDHALVDDVAHDQPHRRPMLSREAPSGAHDGVDESCFSLLAFQAGIQGFGDEFEQRGSKSAEFDVHGFDTGLVEFVFTSKVVVNHRKANLGLMGDRSDRSLPRAAIRKEY